MLSPFALPVSAETGLIHVIEQMRADDIRQRGDALHVIPVTHPSLELIRRRIRKQRLQSLLTGAVTEFAEQDRFAARLRVDILQEVGLDLIGIIVDADDIDVFAFRFGERIPEFLVMEGRRDPPVSEQQMIGIVFAIDPRNGPEKRIQVISEKIVHVAPRRRRY